MKYIKFNWMLGKLNNKLYSKGKKNVSILNRIDCRGDFTVIEIRNVFFFFGKLKLKKKLQPNLYKKNTIRNTYFPNTVYIFSNLAP